MHDVLGRMGQQTRESPLGFKCQILSASETAVYEGASFRIRSERHPSRPTDWAPFEQPTPTRRKESALCGASDQSDLQTDPKYAPRQSPTTEGPRSDAIPHLTTSGSSRCTSLLSEFSYHR